MLIQIDDPHKREYYELEAVCTGKNDTAVRMALPEDNRTILASEYKLYLPTQDQLIDEVNSVRRMMEEKAKMEAEKNVTNFICL